MSSVNVGTAVAYLDLDAGKFLSGIGSATSALSAFEFVSQTVAKTIDEMGSNITQVGTAFSTALTVPIVGIGTASVKMASDFDGAMSKVQAISGATAEELEALYDKAIEMGAATKFSAQESAEAFTYMAMAGWDAQQMIDGIGGIMSLAAADGLDLATTSDIVTDALTAFGLQAEDSAHFADVLAQASSSANTNVQMLGESFKYVGPVAGALSFSVEDVALALGLMANSGIKSTQAGTTLRAALASLTKPTDNTAEMMRELGIEIANSDGSMKELSEIMDILRDSFSNLTEVEQANAAAVLFGREAMSGMLAIVNASEEDYNKLAEAISNADGRADEMAGTMMNNLPGAVEEMMGAIESLLIKVGSVLVPIVRKVTEFVTLIVDKLNTLSDAQLEQILKIAALVAAIGPLIVGFGGVVSVVTEAVKIFSRVQFIFTMLATSILPLIGGLMSMLTTAGGVIGIFVTMFKTIKNLIETNEEFRTRISAIWERVQQIFLKAGEFFNKFKETVSVVFRYLNGVNADSFIFSLLSIAESVLDLYDTVKPALDILVELIGISLVGAIIYFASMLEGVAVVVNKALSKVTEFMEKTSYAINILKDLGGAVISVFRGDFGSAAEYLTDIGVQLSGIVENMFLTAITSVHTFIQNFLALIEELFNTLPEKIGYYLGLLLFQLQELGTNILNWMSEQFPIWLANIESFLKSLPTTVWNLLTGLVSRVKDIGPSMNEAGKSIFTALWEGLKTTWESIKSWFEEVKLAIQNFVSGILQGYNEARTAASSISGSHANGLSYVPYNGYVAELHQGERVLTREENKDYSEDRTSSGDTFIFNSPKAIDEYEAARLLKKTKEELDRDYE